MVQAGCAVWFVIHGQENAADDLNHQHQHGQRAKEIPEVKVFRRVVFANVVVVHFGERKTGIHPTQ